MPSSGTEGTWHFYINHHQYPNLLRQNISQCKRVQTLHLHPFIKSLNGHNMTIPIVAYCAIEPSSLRLALLRASATPASPRPTRVSISVPVSGAANAIGAKLDISITANMILTIFLISSPLSLFLSFLIPLYVLVLRLTPTVEIDGNRWKHHIPSRRVLVSITPSLSRR